MNQETIAVAVYQSGTVEFSRLVVSVRKLARFTSCEAVVGYPGLPNVVQQLHIGDAVLYETTEDGILEVRATSVGQADVQFIVSQVSPRIGLVAGLLTEDPGNSPFSPPELQQIAQSVLKTKEDLASGDFLPEQLALIERKLDEIQSASERLGRKDWLNYFAGSLTGLCIAAAFAPDATKQIFRTVSAAFVGLFGAFTAVQLLIAPTE